MIDIERNANSYVVEGILLDDARFQKVTVSTIRAGGKSEPVEDATVTIECDNGDQWQFEYSESGFYALPSQMDLVEGASYRMVVVLEDESSVVSSWEIVPEKVLIQNAYWEQGTYSYFNNNGIELKRRVFKFLVDTGIIPGDDTSLRYEYETTHINEAPFAPAGAANCYITTVPTNFISTLHFVQAQGKSYQGHLVDFATLDKRFSLRFTMLVRQITHSPSAHSYYRAIEQQKKLRGTIFDPPPATIAGNLTTEGMDDKVVYGLFEVGQLDEAVINVFRGDFENSLVTYFSECQAKLFAGDPAPECYSCAVEKGAGPRPYYF